MNELINYFNSDFIKCYYCYNILKNYICLNHGNVVVSYFKLEKQVVFYYKLNKKSYWYDTFVILNSSRVFTTNNIPGARAYNPAKLITPEQFKNNIQLLNTYE